ncbi:hypothetical protein ACFL6L_04425 [candidate division KSB1 bacterium]
MNIVGVPQGTGLAGSFVRNSDKPFSHTFGSSIWDGITSLR